MRLIARSIGVIEVFPRRMRHVSLLTAAMTERFTPCFMHLRNCVKERSPSLTQSMRVVYVTCDWICSAGMRSWTAARRISRTMRAQSAPFSISVCPMSSRIFIL